VKSWHHFGAPLLRSKNFWEQDLFIRTAIFATLCHPRPLRLRTYLFLPTTPIPPVNMADEVYDGAIGIDLGASTIPSLVC
jgi:hypothetical protein